jgi:condensation domain-containing protein
MVPFRGDGAGSGELSWGQRELWGGMVRQGSWFPIGVTRPLPPGTTVDQLAERLGSAMSRHPSMRTRLAFDADPERPRQVAAGDGEIRLEIVDAGEEDPAAVAARVEQRFRDTGYDFARDWPVRMAVVCRRGRPTHRVLVMCHLVTDGFGATLLAADLAGRDAAAPVTGMQPLAQARWQASPAGRRQHGQAMRYWERLLRTIPARRFRGSEDRRRPRYWQARLSSPGMHLAAQSVAARTGADTSTVLLAAFSVAQARITGINPAVTRVLVSNRFRPRLADVVAPVSQPALCMMDVAGAGFDDAVARTRRHTMAAYKYAYYDTYQLPGLIDRVGGERGEQLDIACFFNDRRTPAQREPAGSPPSREDLRAALPRTRFGWGPKIEYGERLFLHIEEVPDTVSIAMWADTHHTAPADIENLLLTMEAAVVDAAFAAAAVGGAP